MEYDEVINYCGFLGGFSQESGYLPLVRYVSYSCTENFYIPGKKEGNRFV
jgi:hypothetical protein